MRVTVIDPMKRELKVMEASLLEEQQKVTVIDPMKRELKEVNYKRIIPIRRSYSY